MSVYFDLFERISVYVEQHEHWEADEILSVLMLVGGASLVGLAVMLARRYSRGARLEFIKELASHIPDTHNTAAVFVVEMGEEVSEDTVGRAADQLEHFVGERNVTFFRVR
jgi:hypothetical protein